MGRLENDPRTKRQLIEEVGRLSARLDEAERDLRVLRSGDPDSRVGSEHEEARRARETSLAAIAENLPNSVLSIVDRDFRYLFTTGAALAELELSAGSLIGRTIYEIQTPERAEKVAGHWREVLDGRTVTFETRFRERVFQTSTAPLRDSEGRVARMLVLSTDITEHKRIEAESERLASFPRLNPNPITEVALDGRASFMNPAAERLMPDLAQHGPAHPWLADWASVAAACEAGATYLPDRDVLVGGHWYRQTMHYNAAGRSVRIYGVDVTERKRIEQELHTHAIELERQNEELRRDEASLDESRARYFDLYDLAPAGYLTTDAQGTILEANLGAANLLGTARGTLTSRQLTEFIATEGQDDYYHWRRRLVVSGRSDPCELPLRGEGGAVVWLRLEANVAEEPGRGTVFRHTLVDVTARRHAEEQLRATLESIGDGFFACDGDWRFVYVNAAAERILGIRREDVLGRSHWEVFPLTLGTNLEREYRAAAAGHAREFENHYEPWDRWFHNRCFPREGGGMSVYFEDITGRKRAADAIRESEQRFRLALRNAPVSVAAQDRDLRFVWAYNQRSARPEEIIGKLDAEIFTAGEAERLVAIKRRVLEEGVEHRERMWLDRPGGRMYLDVCFEPLRDAAGRVTGVGTATIDLTQIKLAEEELRASNEVTQRLNRVMVGRELRMIELKREVNTLCTEAGQPPRYAPDFAGERPAPALPAFEGSPPGTPAARKGGPA